MIQVIRHPQWFLQQHPAFQCVATFGNFDGMHCGHQRVLQHLIAAAQQSQRPSLVVLFEPQPAEFFAPAQAPARLMRLRDKIIFLHKAGVDFVVCLRFNQQLASCSAEFFIKKILLDQLGVVEIIVGSDVRWGSHRAGNLQLLQQLAQQMPFRLTVLTRNPEEDFSSTRVRQALHGGDLALAARLLGNYYTIAGRVIHGQALGRQLGFPTANIRLLRKKSPLTGIFVVRVTGIDGHVWPGVAYIAKSAAEKGQGLLEVHLIDFSGDLYGQCLDVAFIHKLRDDQSFSSEDDLKQAIAQDLVAAKKFY